jgi:hypothetical protein
LRLGRPTCSSAARPVGPRDRSCRGPAPASLRSSPASRPWGRSVRRVGDCRGQCRTRQVILGERVSDQHGHMVSRSPEGGRWITDDSARSGQIADQSRRYRSSGRVRIEAGRIVAAPIKTRRIVIAVPSSESRENRHRLVITFGLRGSWAGRRRATQHNRAARRGFWQRALDGTRAYHNRYGAIVCGGCRTAEASNTEQNDRQSSAANNSRTTSLKVRRFYDAPPFECPGSRTGSTMRLPPQAKAHGR